MCLAVNTWSFMFSPNFSEYPKILSLNLRDKDWKKLWWYAVYHFCKNLIFLSLKKMGRGWGAGCVNLISRCGFSKNVFSRERVNLCFFVTFNVIVSHIFHENFNWSFSSHLEDMKNFFFVVNYIYQVFGFFHILLLQKSEWH